MEKLLFEVLTDIANCRSSDIESKSLYNIRISLEEMGLIEKIAMGQFVINDILLTIYLKSEFDSLSVENMLMLDVVHKAY